MSENNSVESVDAFGFGRPKQKENTPENDLTPVIPLIEGDEYKMDHKRRGKAIIFNHLKFDIADMGARIGTEIDCDRLRTVLDKRYGFEVLICQDYKYGKIYDTLQQVAKEDHQDSDCLLIAVMSHGEKGQLYAKDTLYRVEELWTPFTNCPSLVGKPKIFFIQACRGEQLDSGNKVRFDSIKMGTIPTMADILVMYSTFDGFYSFRSPQRGSWFIQRLCDELENEDNRKRDFLQTLTLVNRKMALYDQSYNPYNVDFHKKKQVGSIVSSLTRILYLTRKDGDNCKTNETNLY